jgi:prophage regulatory protein
LLRVAQKELNMTATKTTATDDRQAKPLNAPIAFNIKAQRRSSTIPSFDDLPDSAFIRQSQLVRSPKRPNTTAPWPFSAPTYWRKIKSGTLPKPFKLSERVSAQNVGECRAINAAWAAGKSESEIKELVAQLHAKRTAPATA